MLAPTHQAEAVCASRPHAHLVEGNTDAGETLLAVLHAWFDHSTRYAISLPGEAPTPRARLTAASSPRGSHRLAPLGDVNLVSTGA
jgi:hypothetical protein